MGVGGRKSAAQRRCGAGAAPFIIPVVIDDTPEQAEGVPDEFLRAQWARLPGGAGDANFRDRIKALTADAAAARRALPKDLKRAEAKAAVRAVPEVLQRELERVEARVRQANDDVNRLTGMRDKFFWTFQQLTAAQLAAAPEDEDRAAARAFRRARAQLANAERDLNAATARRDMLQQDRDVLRRQLTTAGVAPAVPRADSGSSRQG
jgi:hypothetical protein